MDCKVFPFMTSSSCTEPPNEKRFETYRRKNETLNWTLLYLRSTWNFPFKDECANLMSSSTLGIHGFVDLIFSIKITRIILSGNKKGLFVFTFSVITAGSYYAGKEKWHRTACVILPQAQPNLRWNFQAQPADSSSPVRGNGTAVPRFRFGAGQSRSPVGTLGALTFLQVLLLSSQRSTACAHSTLACKLCYYFFSAGLLCACSVCVHKCTCAQCGTAKGELCCKIKSCPHPGSSAVLSWPRF